MAPAPRTPTLVPTAPGNNGDETRLSPDTLIAVKRLARKLGNLPPNDAIQRAVGTELQLHDATVLQLSADAKKAVEEISERLGGLSTEQVISRSIGTLLYLLRQEATGHRVLLEGRHGRKLKQLVVKDEVGNAPGGSERP